MSLIKLANELLNEETRNELIEREAERTQGLESSLNRNNLLRAGAGAAALGLGAGAGAAAGKMLNRGLGVPVGIGAGAGAAAGAILSGRDRNSAINALQEENAKDSEFYSDNVSNDQVGYYQKVMDDERIDQRSRENLSNIKKGLGAGAGVGAAVGGLAQGGLNLKRRALGAALGGSVGASAGALGAASQNTLRPQRLLQGVKEDRIDDLLSAYQNR